MKQNESINHSILDRVAGCMVTRRTEPSNWCLYWISYAK